MLKIAYTTFILDVNDFFGKEKRSDVTALLK